MARSKARLANDAWEALLTVHAELLRQMRAADLWDEVSMREYDVIYTLSKCGGPLRQSELSRHVLLSQPAISRLVERLVARGLVARAADPVDGRGVLLTLTEEGAAAQRRIGARHAADVTRLVSAHLTRPEMEELDRLLRRLSGSKSADRHARSTKEGTTHR